MEVGDSDLCSFAFVGVVPTTKFAIPQKHQQIA
ncbi:MAG: hypothetical protein JWP94_697 [Mucilaginibacter sp.]|nr:hypothetical protein [Mucilaginibacter sp.]